MKRKRKPEVIFVPITFEGRRVGKASLSEDGTIITTKLDSTDDLPAKLREALMIGIADSFSIAPNYVNQPSDEKRSRWEQSRLPWGM